MDTDRGNVKRHMHAKLASIMNSYANHPPCANTRLAERQLAVCLDAFRQEDYQCFDTACAQLWRILRPHAYMDANEEIAMKRKQPLVHRRGVGHSSCQQWCDRCSPDTNICPFKKTVLR